MATEAHAIDEMMLTTTSNGGSLDILGALRDEETLGAGGDWSPAQALADAVITQAFRDLNNFACSTRQREVKIFDSAKAFLKGETPEGRTARKAYFDTIGLNPEYGERMADAVIAQALQRGTVKKEDKAGMKEDKAGMKKVA